LLVLLLSSATSSDGNTPVTTSLYFNAKDVYHVTCWPIDAVVDTDAGKARAAELRKAGYEYFGMATTTLAGSQCENWHSIITEREDKDQAFIDTGIPSKGINVEYYANHAQCRWLPMHSGERISTTSSDSYGNGTAIPVADPEEDGQRPASGPWCYILDGNGKPEPARCLSYCGAIYETERKRKAVAHTSLVPPPHVNHNPAFTEHLGTVFDVSPSHKAMIYVKPSMESHADELLEQKRIVFYVCCGVVGAVILWITACHFLGLRVKRRRLAILAIQRQAISASITRRRRESQAEHEEEDARER
ncbi:hypothetical protein PRIPAC_84899, partial [Pristionchus pacificus]|uniref:Kringle domain-containing protein n=1 Tax=Pristionchus pacificus TaxID=54126 RepID=A0A8R1YT26_PRIPA